jgi:cysteine desulfurase / selenocysteine lyase
MSKSVITMSTSNLDAADRIPAGQALEQGRAEAAGAPVSLAELAGLANAFFRALPGQAVPAGFGPGVPAVGLPAAPGFAAPASTGIGSTGPSLAAVAPPLPIAAPVPSATAPAGLVSRAPEFGIPLPGVPSLPASDKLPSEAELIRLAGEAGSPVASGVIPPPASTVPGIPGAQALSTSALSTPGATPAAFAGPGLAAPLLAPAELGQAPAIPVSAAANPAAGLPGYGLPDVPTDWAGAALSGAGASPFSLPFPQGQSGLDERFFNPRGLNFDAALPAIPGLEKYASEEEATALGRSVTTFYFLEDAGTLLKPGGSVPALASAYNPDLLGDLKLTRGLFDLSSARRDFPILNERVNGKPLVWLDNAATTQKPQSVIDRISWFYEHENSNIHRAAHELAARATDAFEDARQKAARFLNAPSSKEIVFVRGATEGINLVAKSWGKRHVQKGDEIIVSTIEHHANIVPWQQLCAECGAVLRVIPVDDDGQVLLDEYEKLLNPRTRLVSIAQVSNALGTILPAEAIVAAAHRYGARVLVDGAQSVSHLRADVQALDCDFFVFSGHKVFGPTGIGVVYGKPDALAESPPWQGGGNMIVDVTFEKTTYQVPPGRFEAGTGNIADAVGLGAAIDYVQAIGIENIARHEHELLQYAIQGLKTIRGLRLIGTAKEKAAVLSFVLEGFKTEEVGAALNREGIAVRSGHHCAQPSLRRFGVETTVRPSLALYNNYEDIDALITALRRLKSVGA